MRRECDILYAFSISGYSLNNMSARSFCVSVHLSDNHPIGDKAGTKSGTVSRIFVQERGFVDNQRFTSTNPLTY